MKGNYDEMRIEIDEEDDQLLDSNAMDLKSIAAVEDGSDETKVDEKANDERKGLIEKMKGKNDKVRIEIEEEDDRLLDSNAMDLKSIGVVEVGERKGLIGDGIEANSDGVNGQGQGGMCSEPEARKWWCSRSWPWTWMSKGSLWTCKTSR